MALTQVTDPDVLSQLNSAPALKPVSDPALLAQLNSSETKESPGLLQSAQNYIVSGAQGLADAVSKWGHSVSINPITNAESTVEAGRSIVQNMASAPLAIGAKIIGDERPIKDIRDSLSYTPESEGGKAILNVVGAATKPVNDVLGAVNTGISDVTGIDKDAVQAGTDTAMIASIAKSGISGVKRGADIALPEAARTATPTEVARAAQYKLRPSDIAKIEPGANVGGGKFIEKFGGSNDLRKNFIEPNQANTTRLASEEIGLPADTKSISPKTLDELTLKPREAYKKAGDAAGEFETTKEFHSALDEISQRRGLEPDIREKIDAQVEQYRAQNLDGADVVKTVSALRRRASNQIKNKDVGVQDQGIANRAIADALEHELERHIDDPSVVTEFKDARVQLAKIYNVETALRAGQVDANLLRRLQKRGAPLTGNLKTIADTAEYFPYVTKHPLTYADIGGAKNLGHETLYSEVKAAPASLARKYLGSDVYQNKLGADVTGLLPLKEPNRINGLVPLTAIEQSQQN